MYAQVAQAQSCANHVQHMERIWRATCVTRHIVRRDSSAIKVLRSFNNIYFSFILLVEPLNWWRRGGNRSTQRKPLAMSFRKCHILKPEDSSPKWDSNPHNERRRVTVIVQMIIVIKSCVTQQQQRQIQLYLFTISYSFSHCPWTSITCTLTSWKQSNMRNMYVSTDARKKYTHVM